jgi:hypothetical protein
LLIIAGIKTVYAVFLLFGPLTVYFFTGQDTLWIGILGTILASIGFGVVLFL